ncbi:MAG: hypothetical protein LBQ57_04015, partial [Spirochaetales bacterium]|nr:hypothetical protein [Spirochaetales bacterium]
SNSKFEKICPAIPKSIQIVSNLNAFTHKKRFQTAIPYLVAGATDMAGAIKKANGFGPPLERAFFIAPVFVFSLP